VTLVDIHGRLAYTAIFYTVVMALWGVWRFFRKQNVDSSYWGALVIAEILYIAQTLLGTYLYLFAGRVPVGGGMHILYGVVAILVLPAMFFFTRGDETRRAQLVYGAGFLFMIGILLRSIATGG
jgi:hypothetical protein